MQEIQQEGIIDAGDLAEYLLKNYGPLSPLKLQLLLFYCEGYHLAVFEKELLKEEFLAWVPGPICIEVANRYKYRTVLPGDLTYIDKGNDPDIIFAKQLTADQKELLTGVLEELSDWREIELQTLVQEATPWLEARAGYASDEHCDAEISKSAMKDFYKTEMGS